MTRVLIVRLGSLGDIVHALPAAAAIRRAWPQAEIDWLVDARHAEFLDLVPIIDRRIVLGRSSVNGRASSRLHRSRRWSEVPAVVRELRHRHYELALDFQGLLKSALLARASGAARVVGFSRARLREPMAAWFYNESIEPHSRRGANVVFKNLGLVAALGIPADRVEFPLQKRESATLRVVRERLKQRGDTAFALINGGAAWPNKRWGGERFGLLAQLLRERHGLSSFVLWGPGEEALAQQIEDSSTGAAEVAPPTSLADLVSLTSAAAVLVSGDTGPLHIAAAVGTPLVGIFGPTSPIRNGPWRLDDVTVSRFELCQCHHLRRCRARDWCLADVSVEEVAAAVSVRLQSAKLHV